MGNRMHATVTLAIEAAKAALATWGGPEDLSGIWQHFDWQLIEVEGRVLVKLVVSLIGIDEKVTLVCDQSPLLNGRIYCQFHLGRMTDGREACCDFRQDGNRLVAA